MTSEQERLFKNLKMNPNKSSSEQIEKPCNIIAVDVGTTLMTCHLFDKFGISKYSTTRKIKLLHPQAGWVEIEPYHLWEQFQDVIWETMEAEQISAENVTALGISTQRGTFVTWDRKTGKPQHNFISWQDLRSSDHTENWNKSFALKSLQAGSKLMHMISRRKQFLAGSVINFSTQQVTMRLHYLLKNHPEMEWSSIVTTFFNIPASILPKIVDTSGPICESVKDIFGAPIPIRAVVADQQSAMFGQCCFDVGDIKCTMGTGTFIDINTGKYPHVSVAGLYPLVAWKIGSETVYMAEGNAAGTATAIEWSKSMGFFDDVNDTSDMAFSVESSDDVYFVPAFNGLQAPINDNKACVSLMGIKVSTTKCHIVRAVLESIAFRFMELYETVLEETQVPVVTSIKADGGVCNNDFVMELTSSLTGQSLDKPYQTDMSALGAAFLAGMASGVWKSRDELKAIRCTHALYQPKTSIREKYKKTIKEWKEAVQRSRNWYP